MTAGLLNQLRNYADDFDAVVAPITLDEVTTRATAPGSPLRFPGWAYAVMTAVLVLVVGVGTLFLDRLLRVVPPPETTTTTVTTTTTTLETTSTTTPPRPVRGPPPYIQPRMVYAPGAGVLLELDAVWSFRTDTGWTRLAKPSLVLVPNVWIWGYDPVSQLAWGDDPGTATEDSGFIGEMWTYAPMSGEWAHVETTGAISTPEKINDFSAVLDTESRRLIFVGGFAEAGTVETWALDLDGKEWTKMSPDVAPSARLDFPIAYDAGSDRVILFGGWDLDVTKSSSDETWAYDFNTDTWTRMDPPSSPPPSHSGTMTYDPVTDRMILFGGAVTGLSFADLGKWGESLDDTWAYDYNSDTWTEIVTSTSPSSREYPGMIHDAETGLIVLFGGGRGGYFGEFAAFDDTWLLDPGTETWTEWTPVAVGEPVPPPEETTTTTQPAVGGRTCAQAKAEDWEGEIDSDDDGEFTLSLTRNSEFWCVDVSNVAVGDWTIDIDVDPNETLDVLTVVLRDAFAPGDACAEAHPSTVTGQDNIYTLTGIDSLGPDLDGVNGCDGEEFGPQYGDDAPAFAFLVFARVRQDNSGAMTVTYPTR